MATLEELELKKQQIEQQIKAKKARAKQQERKDRTKRLIVIGADVESIFGKVVNRDEFYEWLKTQTSFAKGTEIYATRQGHSQP